MHINYVAIFFYRTCTTYIFHMRCFTLLDQQNKFHIFLTYILFTMYFSINQQNQELIKVIYKSTTKMTCNNFFTVDLVPISLTKFVLTNLELLSSSYDFWKHLNHFWKSFSKTPFKNPDLECYVHTSPCTQT
jgi:hypothetical protein